MTPKNQILSPLRYPGSKRALVGYIKETLTINSLVPSVFVEPFVGGASVVINLLNDELVENAILVDIDPWITSFWQTVFYDTEWLIDQINTLEITIENWKKYKYSNPQTIRDQAITCFFLNRTNFSGILESRVGPIGGKDQNSKYLIDCRFTQKTRITLINRINQISSLRGRILRIWNCSWKEATSKIQEEQKAGKLPVTNLFYYLDPPFFEEANALYRFFFNDQDHLDLRDYLLKLEEKWLLSYDSADQFYKLYDDALKKSTNGTKHHKIDLLYTVAKISTRKNAKEVIVSNLDKLPESLIKNGVKKENN